MFASTLPKNTMTQIRQVALVDTPCSAISLSLWNCFVQVHCFVASPNDTDGYSIRGDEKKNETRRELLSHELLLNNRIYNLIQETMHKITFGWRGKKIRSFFTLFNENWISKRARNLKLNFENGRLIKLLT